jgi:hypothetical protein
MSVSRKRNITNNTYILYLHIFRYFQNWSKRKKGLRVKEEGLRVKEEGAVGDASALLRRP